MNESNKNDWMLILLFIAFAVAILLLIALVASIPVTEPPKMPAFK
jgi:hypothetical protein